MVVTVSSSRGVMRLTLIQLCLNFRSWMLEK